MSTTVFWTHGIATIVEFPDRCTEIRRDGFGTKIVQPYRGNQENNWFHLPLTSPSVFRSQDVVVLRSVRLEADTNYSQIVEIHVRQHEHLLFSESVKWPPDNQVSQPTRLAEGLRVGPPRSPPLSADHVLNKVSGGLVLCVRVLFPNGALAGQIHFRGARAKFHT